MTTIDASKNQLLPILLRKLVIGLTQLSSADLELQQVITKLNHIRGNLAQLSVEDFMATLEATSHYALGYDLKEFKTNEFVKSLPEVIEALKEELDNLVAASKIGGKTAMEIFQFATYFDKLAGK